MGLIKKFKFKIVGILALVSIFSFQNCQKTKFHEQEEKTLSSILYDSDLPTQSQKIDDVSLSPYETNFGSVVIGSETVTKSIVLKNPRDEDKVIEKLEITAETAGDDLWQNDFTLDQNRSQDCAVDLDRSKNKPFTLRANSSCNINVKFNPKQSSSRRLLVVVHFENSDHTASAIIKAIGTGAIINGACGNLNGRSATAPPSDADACTYGTKSNLRTSGDNYIWSCAGINGGAAVQCSASYTATFGCVQVEGHPANSNFDTWIENYSRKNIDGTYTTLNTCYDTSSYYPQNIGKNCSPNGCCPYPKIAIDNVCVDKIPLNGTNCRSSSQCAEGLTCNLGTTPTRCSPR